MAISIKASAFLLMAVISAAVAMGAVYKVGDSAGWTNAGDVDYKAWSTDKHFRVGDVIVFENNKAFENVLRVTHINYNTCNGTSPYAAFTATNNSFTVEKPGHFYFISSLPVHCHAGQRVDIRIPPRQAPESSPAPSPQSPTPPSSTPTLPPSESAAPSVEDEVTPFKNGATSHRQVLVSLAVAFILCFSVMVNY